MAFTPKILNANDINNGNLYVDKQDSPQADAFNRIIEGVLYNNKKLEEALYKPIDITSFTAYQSIFEKGSSVSVSLSWNINKTPTSQTINNVSVSNDLRTKTYSDVTTDTTYTLKATDEKGEFDTRSVKINFYNGVYYGVATEPTSYDSTFILGLTKSLQGSKAKTFTVTAGEGQYIYYCLPSSYGTPNFNVGGFDGGFEKVSTISFTNATNNHTENYDIYRSDNANLGTTTVKVS